MGEKFLRVFQAKWDKKNMRTFSTRMTTKQAERIRRLCDNAGLTPYRLLQLLLWKWANEQENPPEQKTMYFY